jgi:hypothetical protein
MTRQEMKDYVRIIKTQMEGYTKPKGGWLYSWDNAPNNMRTFEMPEVGLTAESRFELPPYGPDLHKAIEHPMNFLKRGFKADATALGRAGTPEEYQQMLRHVFESMSQEQVAADVATLPRTYLAVATDKGVKAKVAGTQLVVEGSGGDWPLRMYR